LAGAEISSFSVPNIPDHFLTIDNGKITCDAKGIDPSGSCYNVFIPNRVMVDSGSLPSNTSLYHADPYHDCSDIDYILCNQVGVYQNSKMIVPNNSIAGSFTLKINLDIDNIGD
jgi:hypothetical protein